MGEPESLRVLLLGKQGCGKSSLANLLLGESVFSVSHRSNKEIRRSQSHTRTQTRTQTRPQTGTRTLTVVDSPGLVGTPLQGASGRAQRCEWLSALLQCAPGPHAVLLVMSVQRYTCQEEAVVRRVRTLCGDQVFGFLTVVFTHGDQLPEDMHMVQFVEQSAGLTELVQACGGRCHVVDNKYWNREPPEDSYRSNAFQVQEILATVEKTARQNQTFFSNDTLLQVEREIQAETMRIQSSSGLSPGPGLGPGQDTGPGQEESREQAKTLLLGKYMKEATARPPYLKYTVMAAAGVLGVAVICYTLPKVIRWLREVPLVPEMVPEVPLVPEMVPEVPLVPEIVPEVPLVPEIVPEVVLVPGMLPEVPLVPHVPVIPACDIYPDLPLVPEMVPEVPLVPEMVPEVPMVPEMVPGVPMVPEMVPEVPLVSEIVPEVPLVPEMVPEVPLVPKMVPEVPLVPEMVPEVPLVPKMVPEVPLVSEIVPEVPLVPEIVPEVPLVPIDPSPSPLREVLEFILTKPEELFDKFDPYDLFLW